MFSPTRLLSPSCTPARAFRALASLVACCLAGSVSAATLKVPSTYTTVQAALDVASAGDEIHVDSGIYNEKVVFASSGDAMLGPIVLRADPGAATPPVLDGTGVAGANMILIDTKSYVQVIGFEIVNNLGVNDGSGIRVLGSGTDIELRDNVIHEIRGKHAMGITVYGTDASPIKNLLIDNNEIFDCDPARSEALAVNGNVDGFVLTNNLVRDVNNIGIVMIGGETDIQPTPGLVARNGLVRGNTVIRARSIYGGGFAGAIYVDGGRDIVIENNVTTESDLGIEVGAENTGLVARNVVVRNNVFYRNDKAGIVVGGFAAGVGRANSNIFRGNTLYANNTLSQSGNGQGEIWIQYAENNVFENNIVVADGQGDNVIVESSKGSVDNTFDYNIFHTVDGLPASFTLNGASLFGFASWQSGTGNDANSVFADPQLIAPAAADFHIATSSPAFDGGNPAYVSGVGETDLDGSTRISGFTVDAGADEASCGDGVIDPGEECDDGNPVNGDGCDSNCRYTSCGNGVATAGEDCDDGNTVDGDCCAGDCVFEVQGAPCSDGEVCSLIDRCDGSGTCVADADSDPSCVVPLSGGRSLLKLRSKNGRDLLTWRWGNGPTVSKGDLGDPTASDSQTLCVYLEVGGVSSVLLSITAPSGDEWRDLGSRGYKYKDYNLTPDGVKTVQLRPGDFGKARAKLKAKGPNMDMPAAGLGFDPAAAVIAQLRHGNGVCHGTVFSAPFRKNDSGRFIDNGD
ncbi:MAG: right-handed parallel beta-helix repeat-containing protein [Candidatus Krumholzibacteriia bacterium]